MKIIEVINRKRKERLQERAKSLYQITEHNGELWLTFGSSAVVPCSMLNCTPLEALASLRQGFIDRVTQE